MLLKSSQTYKPNYMKIIPIVIWTLACLGFLFTNRVQASSTNELQSETIPVKNDYKNIIQTRNVTQTIYYQYEDGSQAAPTYKNIVNFKRVDIQNEDNNIIVNPGGQWVPVKQSFKEVVSPQLKGFIPDKTSIKENSVDPAAQNITDVVVYHPIKSNQQVQNFNKIKSSVQNQGISSNKKEQSVLPVVVHDETKLNNEVAVKKINMPKDNVQSVKVLPETGENKMTIISYCGFMLVLIAVFLETYLVTEKN
ncbi:mucin-binding protein [uncultured Lactobacillus sp.]|uniref:mucin-binding protein n=1 Tax=uncultured Lactobacillus sp. TaxID=153152 RepID=UPI0026160C0A|nr:hypothetical protein [uncultured Lactobacillus sp.]